MQSIPDARDKPLFTPGPLTTSSTVKQAMLHDLGSRDAAFLEVVADIRSRLLQLGGVSQELGWEAVPVQGSGTFAIESVISSMIGPEEKLLVLANGAYGRRIGAIARVHGIETVLAESPEDRPLDVEQARRLLEQESPAHVATVHCETTTGILNPIEAIGALAHEHGATYLVDSMSAFGAEPVCLDDVDFLVSSANKAIEGVPGFAFVLARRTALKRAEAHPRTLCLDLRAQWEGLEGNGQFRFTPPTHTLLAFRQALLELEQEGGVNARRRRYAGLQQRIHEGMGELGFEAYIPREHQSCVITTFRCPATSSFTFERFYSLLNERGYVIYPGKVSDAECFRIGSIGRLFPADVEDLLAAVAAVMKQLEA